MFDFYIQLNGSGHHFFYKLKLKISNRYQLGDEHGVIMISTDCYFGFGCCLGTDCLPAKRCNRPLQANIP